MRAALVERVRDAGVTVVAPASFASLAWSSDRPGRSHSTTAARSLPRSLSAPTARSWYGPRGSSPRPYGQTALVANFACERRHGGIAPVVPARRRRARVAAAAGRAHLDRVVGAGALPPAPRSATMRWPRVEAAGARALGRLECVRRRRFSAVFLKLPAVVAHRLALVGDAAHGIHPLAGRAST